MTAGSHNPFVHKQSLGSYLNVADNVGVSNGEVEFVPMGARPFWTKQLANKKVSLLMEPYHSPCCHFMNSTSSNQFGAAVA